MNMNNAFDTMMKCGGEKQTCSYCTNKETTPTRKDLEIENKYLTNRGPYENEITFKAGCRVMSIINISKDNESKYTHCDIEKSSEYSKWESMNDLMICNGSVGTVTGFKCINKDKQEFIPRVRYDHGITMDMHFHTWESDKFTGLQLKQIPLILAYALTIHKAQGATLDRASVDLGRNIFAYGQAYVALSRIRTMDGLYLRDFIPSRIRSNPKVVEFYESFYEE